MSAIFGVRADAYSSATPPLPPSRVDKKSRTNPPDGGYDWGAVAERNKKSMYKNRDDDDS